MSYEVPRLETSNNGWLESWPTLWWGNMQEEPREGDGIPYLQLLKDTGIQVTQVNLNFT